jgi:hypothetical protein
MQEISWLTAYQSDPEKIGLNMLVKNTKSDTNILSLVFKLIFDRWDDKNEAIVKKLFINSKE